MKKLFYIIFSISVFAACKVEVENPNSLTQESFWNTELDAEYGVNAIYNMFYKPGTYARWMWFRFDLTSDEGFSQSPWAELREWTQFTYNNYNFGEGNAMTYAECYQAIFRANQVLFYVPGITFEDETKKSHLLGQAYFLRGLYYYNLAVLWGSENKSVPIVLEPSEPGMQPEGHTEDEVYQQAINDLTEAQNMLPELWTGQDKGRATKGAALALRAKCYMQLHQWQEAQTDLHWLVEGDGKTYYDLVSNYADNFTPNSENNIESVFEIQYSDVNKAPAGDGVNDIDPNLGLHRGQFFAPPGIGWNDGELRPWIVTELKRERNLANGFDIRLKYTAFYQGMENDFSDNSRIYNLTSNNALWQQGNWQGRVFFRKYSSTDRGFDDYYNPTNVRLIRFADVLLMYAECMVESGGALSDAVAYVDRVRARANMPALSVNHFVTTTDRARFLKRLQTERVLELASEGHRWADIKRWGLLDTQSGVDELKQRDVDFNNFVIGRNRSLPIPSDDVNNNPNVEQNPRY
ncbi:RagB/SusD family nutrient uptake outer membrane protein [Sphingobacterium phlebotomi]|uniref:RagB/SusD family nutrient uptake outer membrane protein n=1 Tax=Sphingobacterium phlebotomi TaxID=2605433 RepID=A0A5D4H373_9SPHI|nr:RagB/SusD family nutrient uptake outer membrane protein [Sphingobacterium phlebotomi]TYR34479.1 RagB/SusD family nutrient uptake outer membrane protein [Sphingobacterium phlebotomi]